MKDDRLYLTHILERIERIRAQTAGGREHFFQSDAAQDAVIRNLEVIGEAAKKVSTQLRKQYPDTPWQRISGMRNRLIHDYFDVDLLIVWNVVATQLGPLETQVRAILAALDLADLQAGSDSSGSSPNP
jgi:uncharacterized protein with HEPN domain